MRAVELLPNAPKHNQITPSNALKLHVLRLPAEVRLIIYEYTFIGSTVHIGTPFLEPLTGMSQSTALLRACVQIRHGALSTFFRCCTFDFRWDTFWPSVQLRADIDVAAVKKVQLITICEQAARLLQHGDSCDVPGPHHQAKKEWIHALTSLRRVNVEETLMGQFVRNLPASSVEGVRRVFGNDSLEVNLWCPPGLPAFPGHVMEPTDRKRR